jgi:putative membrane protein
MGAADIVPGVSGGTMAFITGIYETLLSSIRSFDLQCLRLVLRGDLAAAWRHVNGAFLLPLAAGIAASILSLARLLSWTLEHHPVPLWAFFFGLILASAVLLLGQVRRWTVLRVLILVAGVAVALLIALSPSVTVDVGLLSVFGAGFLAICAMILPGISGAFILVLLGMYAPVLAALRSFDLLFIAVFAAGAASGLLCFSRLLSWLLGRFHCATMALLTGFLLGSLVVVWPWKRVVQWLPGSDGELKAVQLVPVTPQQFPVYSGEQAQLMLCLALMGFGLLLVWFLGRQGRGRSTEDSG